MSTKLKSIAALVFVAFGYAILNVVARLLDKSMGPMTQVYMRIALGTLLSLVLFRKKLRLSILGAIPAKDWWLLTVMGTIAYSVAVYCITMGAISANLLNVSVIFSTLGIFVYIYALIFLNEKFKPIIVGLLAISLCGVTFMASKSFLPRFGTFGVGEWFVLLSAAFMALTSICRKLLSKTLNNYEITVIVMIIGAVTSFALALLKGESLPVLVATLPFVVGLVTGALLNITSNFFENYAFEHIDVVLGNQILLLESLFSLVIGVLFYREGITLPELTGAVMILGSAWVSNRVL